jgi:hypothetical protein
MDIRINVYRDELLTIASYATFIFTPYIILIYILPVGRLMKRVKFNIVKKLVD